MLKNLFIVELLVKVKMIEKIFGKDFIVKLSFGYVCDLDKWGGVVDIENDFEFKYVVLFDKKKVVKEFKDLAKKLDEVWFVMDEDCEGEVIFWYLCKVFGFDEVLIKWIVFWEIIKFVI